MKPFSKPKHQLTHVLVQFQVANQTFPKIAILHPKEPIHVFIPEQVNVTQQNGMMPRVVLCTTVTSQILVRYAPVQFLFVLVSLVNRLHIAEHVTLSPVDAILVWLQGLVDAMDLSAELVDVPLTKLMLICSHHFVILAVVILVNHLTTAVNATLHPMAGSHVFILEHLDVLQ